MFGCRPVPWQTTIEVIKQNERRTPTILRTITPILRLSPRLHRLLIKLPHLGRIQKKPAPAESLLFQMLVKPARNPLHAIAQMFRFHEAMPLVLVNHKLRLDPQSLQRVPKFVRLRRWTFSIAIAN